MAKATLRPFKAVLEFMIQVSDRSSFPKHDRLAILRKGRMRFQAVQPESAATPLWAKKALHLRGKTVSGDVEDVEREWMLVGVETSDISDILDGKPES